MAFFKRALPTIWLHEGRFSDNPNDPGGPTNYGISLQFLMKCGDLDKDGWKDGDINHDGEVNAEDIRKLDQQTAENLYYLYFWKKNDYEILSSQIIATKIMDLCINMGNVSAHKCLQRAVRAASGEILTEDGVLGVKTIAVVNRSDEKLLMPALKSEAAGYYRSIKYKGSQDFLKGWLNRAYSNPAVIL